MSPTPLPASQSRLSVNNKAGIPQAYTADPRPDCADVDGTPEADGGDGSCKYYTGAFGSS